VTVLQPRRVCEWCGAELHEHDDGAQLSIVPGRKRRKDARFCPGNRCRQAAHRFGRHLRRAARASEPMRLAYADPPYPGKAGLYRGHPDYAGEVDHRELLSRLQTYDGWALSTSESGLREVVLPVLLEENIPFRIASWHRGARRVRSAWPVSAWEPVVYAGGRRVPSLTAADDALSYVARPRLTDPGRVVGAKPAAFAFWLFGLLGAAPGDVFHDLYPGSGGIGRAWKLFEASPEDLRDASRTAVDDGSGSRIREGWAEHDEALRARLAGTRGV
jgi:hypothetical protein